MKRIIGSFIKPRKWEDTGIKGDIYYNPASTSFYVLKKDGNPGKSHWPYPSITADNHFWLYAGQNPGTFEQPKTWSEYGITGCVYYKNEYGYMRLKRSGDPSKNGWFFPFNGESNRCWEFIGWKAGTFMDAKLYGDGGEEGDIYFSPGQQHFFSLKRNVTPLANDYPFPLTQEDNRDWNFRGSLTTRNWLSFINDTRPVNQLSIPGTHNSATYNISKYSWISPWVKTQDSSIQVQLNNGIRYIDARCRHISNAFTMHHDRFYLGINFGSILNDCYNFLEKNPSEFIFMSVKEEYVEEKCSRSFAETFEKVYDKPTKWFTGDRIPRLEEVRGKIVLISRFLGGSNGLRIDWPDDTIFSQRGGQTQIHVQDKYNERNESRKWHAIKDTWEFAEFNTIKGWLTINFTSIAADTFTSTKSYAQDKNPELANYIKKRKNIGGIIVSDFHEIGDLSKRVIATNFRSVTDI